MKIYIENILNYLSLYVFKYHYKYRILINKQGIINYVSRVLHSVLNTVQKRILAIKPLHDYRSKLKLVRLKLRSRVLQTFSLNRKLLFAHTVYVSVNSERAACFLPDPLGAEYVPK